MAGPAVVVAVLTMLVYAAVIVTALRSPLLARVAVREAIRRPLQSLVVVAGLTVGTGAILGPQVWSDSVTDSLVDAAYRSWGRVDITVAAGGNYFSPDVAQHLAADPELRSSVSGVQAGVELVGSVANLAQRLDVSSVQVIGFDPAAQPPFGAYDLDDGAKTYGEDLRPSEVILSRSLADSVLARAGDRVRLVIGGRANDLSVAGIAGPGGPGAYGLRPAAFVPLATAQRLVGSDLINVVRITARGDDQAEADASRAAVPRVRAVLASTAEGPGLRLREVKAEEADAQLRYQEANRWVFLAFSLLVVAVGTALVVNLIVALAEERRPRLAVLRALGLSRSGAVKMSMLEGALYSLAAAPLSLLTGGLITWIMFAYAADAMGSAIDGRDVAIRLSVRPGTVAIAVALGALFTLLTVFATAVRTSQMTIASAIKDLPEREPARRRSLLRLAGLVVLAAAGILALVAGDVRVGFLGAWILIGVAAALVRGRLSDRTRATVTGGLLTAWSLAMQFVYTPSSLDLDLSVQVGFLSVATSVFGLALVLSANLRAVEALAELLGNASGTLRATVRSPLAYMTRRPLRAGLTIGVLGMVVASITVWTVAATVSDTPEYDRDSGAFDVEVTSAGANRVTLPAAVQGQVIRSILIPTRHYSGPERESFGSAAVATEWHDRLMTLYELSDSIVRNPLPRLSQRDASFASDADVWKTITSDPTWIISSWWGGHGGKVSLVGRDGPVDLKIAGSFAPGLLDGIAGSPEALAAFAESPLGTTLLIDARAGTDPEALAIEIRRSMFSDGIEAFTTKALLDQGKVQARTWGLIFRLLSVLGLVAGVLSLGVLALRSVLERRRAIGILRALGSQPRSVLVGIVIEAMLTTALAILVGLAAGLENVYFIFNANAKVAPIPQFDVGAVAASLATIYGLLLAVTLFVSIGPALRASRLAPVDAMRTVD
jgi:putative ABC transport system permease protein